MKLPRTEASLRRLTEYLWQTNDEIARALLEELTVSGSALADKMNRAKARQFCYVVPNSATIRCARALENVSENVRIGVLLHELGHIVLQAFHSESDDFDDVEVRVDEWCIAELPEAGYHFAHHTYRGLSGRKRVAKSVQHVRAEFSNALQEDF